jgi:hypothetical protein
MTPDEVVCKKECLAKDWCSGQGRDYVLCQLEDEIDSAGED